MRYSIVAIAIAVVATATAGATQEWVAGENRNGVALAFRDDDELRVREVRAIAELPHEAGRITPVACDFTQQLDPDVREARVISGDIATRYTIYLRYAPRFVVVAARDVVIEVRRQQDGCLWSEQQAGAPPAAGAVRMPLLRGSWIVEPLGSARSRVTYQVAVNPGGSIPKWLVRRGAASALPDAIKRLDRCLSSFKGETNARCGAQPVAAILPRGFLGSDRADQLQRVVERDLDTAKRPDHENRAAAANAPRLPSADCRLPVADC